VGESRTGARRSVFTTPAEILGRGDANMGRIVASFRREVVHHNQGGAAPREAVAQGLQPRGGDCLESLGPRQLPASVSVLRGYRGGARLSRGYGSASCVPQPDTGREAERDPSCQGCVTLNVSEMWTPPEANASRFRGVHAIGNCSNGDVADWRDWR
jgi:hypothetical protein